MCWPRCMAFTSEHMRTILMYFSIMHYYNFACTRGNYSGLLASNVQHVFFRWVEPSLSVEASSDHSAWYSSYCLDYHLRRITNRIYEMHCKQYAFNNLQNSGNKFYCHACFRRQKLLDLFPHHIATGMILTRMLIGEKWTEQQLSSFIISEMHRPINQCLCVFWKKSKQTM